MSAATYFTQHGAHMPVAEAGLDAYTAVAAVVAAKNHLVSCHVHLGSLVTLLYPELCRAYRLTRCAEDHFAMLAVACDAFDGDVVKKRYRRLAVWTAPDKFPPPASDAAPLKGKLQVLVDQGVTRADIVAAVAHEAKENMSRLNVAYETLMDADKRAEYAADVCGSTVDDVMAHMYAHFCGTRGDATDDEFVPPDEDPLHMPWQTRSGRARRKRKRHMPEADGSDTAKPRRRRRRRVVESSDDDGPADWRPDGEDAKSWRPDMDDDEAEEVDALNSDEAAAADAAYFRNGDVPQTPPPKRKKRKTARAKSAAPPSAPPDARRQVVTVQLTLAELWAGTDVAASYQSQATPDAPARWRSFRHRVPARTPPNAELELVGLRGLAVPHMDGMWERVVLRLERRGGAAAYGYRWAGGLDLARDCSLTLEQYLFGDLAYEVYLPDGTTTRVPVRPAVDPAAPLCLDRAGFVHPDDQQHVGHVLLHFRLTMPALAPAVVPVWQQVLPLLRSVGTPAQAAAVLRHVEDARAELHQL